MAVIAATGFLAGPMKGMRDLVAASAQFQTEVGVATEADALPFAYPAIDTGAHQTGHWFDSPKRR